MRNYILAIDQSTAGTKALLVDYAGQVVAKCSAEHKQIYPKPGWVEHDPLEIYDNVKRTIREVLTLAGITPASLAAMTITNQRETAMMWDSTTGKPICHAIVWQCQRTADKCAFLQEAGHGQVVRSATGLMLDPYFSASKWEWMLENVESAKVLLAQGKLLAGTMDSWLIWKLTGGRVHATDFTNASRTSLFNIHSLQWDEDMCRLFGVPASLLPEVRSSDDVFGYTGDSDLFTDRIPISGIIGDSQAALFGQMCLETGMAKATYGTGTSVLMNTGEKPATSDSGLVTAVAWARGGKVTYALEAVIRSSGDSIKWVRDNLGLFNSFQELDAILRQTKDNEGVYLVPAFVGLGAPYWDPYARAAITGMNRSTGKAHIVRAAVESIAYQVRDAADMMERETGIPMTKLHADGGASSNRLLMQFQADMLNHPVSKSEIDELSAMGSVYMGGLGVSFWRSIEDIRSQMKTGTLYEPSMEPAVREKLYFGWQRAAASVLNDRSSL
ncbi:glycerol kinase GlpK [Cohnella herbarum]|uniref:ATP:glycerol 3-phosphotransferase n=1 Tax=Cohnella herbarum TaxID=2728023 RepID=A0A7Z2VL15_9BACL|nr:glycerol kinase GlpK [Cohnella herbarum]QJD85032.1 glycerol kinase GlpK [Cohnella herbarum]